MTLPEAMQVFDVAYGSVESLVDASGELVGAKIPGVVRCCGVSLAMNSSDGVARIYCGHCRRSIRKVAGQWVVEDWGDRGIKVARPELIRPAIAAWHLCQALLACREGPTDYLIYECAEELRSALGPAVLNTRPAIGVKVEAEEDVAQESIAERANDAGIRGYRLISAESLNGAMVRLHYRASRAGKA